MANTDYILRVYYRNILAFTKFVVNEFSGNIFIGCCPREDWFIEAEDLTHVFGNSYAINLLIYKRLFRHALFLENNAGVSQFGYPWQNEDENQSIYLLNNYIDQQMQNVKNKATYIHNAIYNNLKTKIEHLYRIFKIPSKGPRKKNAALSCTKSSKFVKKTRYHKKLIFLDSIFLSNALFNGTTDSDNICKIAFSLPSGNGIFSRPTPPACSIEEFIFSDFDHNFSCDKLFFSYPPTRIWGEILQKSAELLEKNDPALLFNNIRNYEDCRGLITQKFYNLQEIYKEVQDTLNKHLTSPVSLYRSVWEVNHTGMLPDGFFKNYTAIGLASDAFRTNKPISSILRMVLRNSDAEKFAKMVNSITSNFKKNYIPKGIFLPEIVETVFSVLQNPKRIKYKKKDISAYFNRQFSTPTTLNILKNIILSKYVP